MTAKKFFGYLFIAISIILTLAVIGQLQRLFHDTINLLKFFKGILDAYKSAKSITTIVFWIIHFFLIVKLWTIGKSWIRQPPGK